jgi:LCP family protein required for cell wall assembly
MPLRHARRVRQQRVRVVAALVAGVALFATSAAAWTYRSLDDNIRSHDIETLLGTDRPTAAGTAAAGSPDPADPREGQPLNLLLVGVDDREGDNARFGSAGQSGVRSDTVILAHIAADRSRVELISIPRDSWVPIPACPLPDGSWSEPTQSKFNQAFAIGGSTGDVGYGVACSIRTLEPLTGVRVDGFVAVDFSGFIRTIDALGGVEMCVPEPIDDPDADIQLEAGLQVLDGEQALGFARARKTLDDGSDTARIGRQQQLLAATIRTVLDQDLLRDSPALLRFLDAATAALTTSDDLGSISSLAGIALSLREIRTDDVTFVTVPWTPRGDGANVLWTAEAEELFAAVAADRPLDGGSSAGETDGGGAADTPGATTTTPEADSPSLGGSHDESESC